MFETRNSVADRLLGMFSADRQRSRLLASNMSADKKEEKDAEGEGGSGSVGSMIGTAVMSAAAITASIMGILKLSSRSGPDGKEMPSMIDKGTGWVKEQFKSKEDKQEQKTTVSASVGPSPLTTSEDVDQYRVKTAKADASAQDAIRKAAEKQVVDYSLLYAIAGAESSFKADASASTSSAVGMFQFTASTWKYLCDQYKFDYTPEDRKDPKKSAQVAGLFVRSINETLQRNLGRNPSYGEVYMGYFLGPTGAVRFLKAAEKDPNAVGAELFPKAAKANPNVFYSRGDLSQPLTLRQILAKQEGKIISYAKDANPNEAVATSPITSKPVQVTFTDPGSSSGNPSGVKGSASSNAGKSSDKSGVSGSQPKVTGTPLAVKDVVSNYTEKAPTPIETQDQQTTGQQRTLAVGSDSKSTQQTTLARGRDGRIYQLNS